MNSSLSRRAWLVRLSAVGIGGATFHRALAHKAVNAPNITPQMIDEAEWIAGIELTEKERESLARQLQAQADSERKLRDVAMDIDVPPATAFCPAFFAEHLPEDSLARDTKAKSARLTSWDFKLPSPPSRWDWSNETDVAQASVLEQARAIRDRKITSVQLTELYLKRLKAFDSTLRCVVNLTEEVALRQAMQADQELAAGLDRGVLHGIPWGAKDIMAVPPFRTTWGGSPYRDQIRPEMATVVQRLTDAGAVLLGKLSVGTYALGDVWYDATTKNPWNIQQGSSGSSAGSASAVGAGLCSFALGTETLGSIVSPSRRCRVTGLRPSFGRVSRFGCMPLSWTMDKVGPIARYAIDCGIVLDAIQGSDGKDPTVVDRPLAWTGPLDLAKTKIGVTQSELSPSEQLVLDVFRDRGARIVPIEYSKRLPQQAMLSCLDVESAAAFDPLFRNAEAESDFGQWGNSFRKSQFIRGIHYVQSLRARTLLIQETERVLRDVDFVLGGDDLLRTNLTGHPSMIVRCGSEELEVRSRTETPSSTPQEKRMVPRTVKLTARFFADATLVAAAHEIENAMPPMPNLPSLFSKT
jgi:Asp-tRNA(Asn)/Glu-tRNA(Gln) amidotransferase A subunit family amidase